MIRDTLTTILLVIILVLTLALGFKTWQSSHRAAELATITKEYHDYKASIEATDRANEAIQQAQSEHQQSVVEKIQTAALSQLRTLNPGARHSTAPARGADRPGAGHAAGVRNGTTSDLPPSQAGAEAQGESGACAASGELGPDRCAEIVDRAKRDAVRLNAVSSMLCELADCE